MTIYGIVPETNCEDKCEHCVNYDNPVNKPPCTKCDLKTKHGKTVLSKFKRRENV